MAGGFGRAVLIGFLCGAVAVAVFHQGTVWLLHAAGLVPAGPFSMTRLPPFGVPRVVSQSFWGGVWGVVLVLLLRATGWPALLTGALVGALALPLVGYTVVAMAHGAAPFAGLGAGWWRSALINAAWGWGAATLLRGAGVARG